jgi:hypothetical protein
VDKSGFHTIITFNYDLVLETLGLAGRVLIPEDADEPDFFADDAIPNVVVLKMHGSVDWRLTKNGIVRARGKHLAAIGKANELAIAPPGPAKAEIAKKSFGRIWARATAAVEKATAVVFIGYRFPETDARARSRLLSAMPKSALTHIVLGADTRHPHALRMHGLLRANRPHSRVVLHPLFSQDFMTVWNGQSLSDDELWRTPSAPPL